MPATDMIALSTTSTRSHCVSLVCQATSARIMTLSVEIR
jgi:hypothetical protein